MTAVIWVTLKTIDLSENKEHQYLNAQQILKTTVIGSVAIPLLGTGYGLDAY